MFIVTILTFNNIKTISRCLSSVEKRADRILVIDGAFQDYPHDKPYSTDGTIEVAKTFPKVEIVTTTKAWISEASKRNAYLNKLNDGDLFLSLNSDEVLKTLDISRFKEPYSYLEYRGGVRPTMSLPRLIKYLPAMAYKTHTVVEHKSTLYDLKGRDSGYVIGVIESLEEDKDEKYFQWKAAQFKKEVLLEKQLKQQGFRLKDISL